MTSPSAFFGPPHRQGAPLLILPDAKWMGKWDTVTTGALLFTAFVTPYEVALLETEMDEPLFFINWVVNLVFIADLVSPLLQDLLCEPRKRNVHRNLNLRLQGDVVLLGVSAVRKRRWRSSQGPRKDPETL
jgi:hypothetical protein